MSCLFQRSELRSTSPEHVLPFELAEMENEPRDYSHISSSPQIVQGTPTNTRRRDHSAVDTSTSVGPSLNRTLTGGISAQQSSDPSSVVTSTPVGPHFNRTLAMGTSSEPSNNGERPQESLTKVHKLFVIICSRFGLMGIVF